MAGGAFITVEGLGDKALARALSQLERNPQRTVARRAVKSSAKRMKRKIAAQLTRHVRTGTYLAAWLQEKVVSMRQRKGVMGYAVFPPPRSALGIAQDDKFYYPWVLEYGGVIKKKRKRPDLYGPGPPPGTKIPAKAPIRKAVNAAQAEEFRLIAKQMKADIEKEWRKIARKSIRSRAA